MTTKINLTNRQIDIIKAVADAHLNPKNESMFTLTIVREEGSIGPGLKLSVEAFDNATQMICEKVFDLTDYGSF